MTEASAPFFDDYAADASTTGTVSVGGSVSGEINSTPSWYNAGDTGGPNGYSSREPGYKGNHYGYSCHEATDDGKLDGDTCDRDWFRVMLTVNRTYKLQLEWVDRRRVPPRSSVPERRRALHSEIDIDSLHLGSRHGRLQRPSWLHRRLHPERDPGVAPLGRRSAAVRCQRGSLLIAVDSQRAAADPQSAKTDDKHLCSECSRRLADGTA